MNAFQDSIDLSEDDLGRTLDRFADGECSPAEEEALLLRLDELPDGWKRCATALLEARDLRAALGGWSEARNAEAGAKALVAPRPARAPSPPARNAMSAYVWYGGAAMFAALAFGAGLLVAPRPADGPSIADHDRESGPAPNVVADAATVETAAPSIESDAPEIVNVVYRAGDDEDRSAPLPVYSSDEAWAKELDATLRKSEADFAVRREKLLAQGHDVERQVVLQSVVTGDGKRMLIPVETFRIVPIVLDSYH